MHFLTRFIGNGNLVTGNVYKDYNNNAVRDSAEPAMPQVFIDASGSNFMAVSNTQEDYVMETDSGNFTIPLTNVPIYHTVNPSVHTATFTGYNQEGDFNDFGIAPILGIRNLEVILTGVSPARPGVLCGLQPPTGMWVLIR
jgi:hypothetical protein